MHIKPAAVEKHIEHPGQGLLFLQTGIKSKQNILFKQ